MVPGRALRPALLVLAALSAPGFAEHDPTHVAPEVVVSAAPERSESLTIPSEAEARRRIDTTPGGVQVIDDEEYLIGRSSTLQDALGFATGVIALPRFGAEEARLSIRGSGIQRTFHLRGIVLLQDGVPLNQADGGGDFQAVDPLATRYIEVWRGANALAYGSSTLGGAINFVSASGHDWPPFQARLEGGSFGYVRSQVSTGIVSGQSDFFGSLTTFNQDGYRDHSQQNTPRAFLNYGYRLRDDLETRFYLSVVNSDSQLPGNLTKRQMQTDPKQANPVNLQQNYQRDFTLVRVANKTVYLVDATSRIEASVYYSYKDLFHPIFQLLDVKSDDYGLELRYLSQAPLFGHGNRLVLGFWPQQGLANDDRYVNRAGARGAPTNSTRQTATNLVLFGEDQFEVLPRTWFVLGAQATEARRKLEDRLITGSGNESFDATYRGVSPKVGVRYDATPTVQFFGNVSRSFEPPSFGELAGGPGITQVQEQTATTYEIGTRGNWAGVSYATPGQPPEKLSPTRDGGAFASIRAPPVAPKQGALRSPILPQPIVPR